MGEPRPFKNCVTISKMGELRPIENYVTISNLRYLYEGRMCHSTYPLKEQSLAAQNTDTPMSQTLLRSPSC